MCTLSQKEFWLDGLAGQVVTRFPNAKLYRTENGIGASGFPHIGSLADAVRSYGVKLALEKRGLRSEHVAYSDDKDGLRKVPKGTPKELTAYLGRPVSSIPDPWNCHQSYGSHMSGLLLEGLEKLELDFTFLSGTEMYRSGRLNVQIEKILANGEKVGAIIQETTRQEKFTKQIPYLPVCHNCGRIYTTLATSYDKKAVEITYECVGGEIAGRFIAGCGHHGERKISEGEGKLPWKAEFAVRWAALGISFEAYGKELSDSIASNDRICREVLGTEPPVHARYELFLNKGGTKMSKSSGELITHRQWLRYGSPASLRLLMLKRIEGAREVGEEDIPVYMAELDNLEDIYFGIRPASDKSEEPDKKSLYAYTLLQKLPPRAFSHPAYNLLVYLCTIAPPEGRTEFIMSKLKDYGISPLDDEDRSNLIARIGYADNWRCDHGLAPSPINLDSEERKIIAKVIELLSGAQTEEDYQSAAYQSSKALGIDAKTTFRAVYRALLGRDSGPRLGPYISSMGRDEVVRRLKEVLNAESSSSY